MEQGRAAASPEKTKSLPRRRGGAEKTKQCCIPRTVPRLTVLGSSGRGGIACGGFCFKRFEESCGQHIGRGLNHPLAHAGDKTADVDVTGVLDFSCAASVFKIE